MTIVISLKDKDKYLLKKIDWSKIAEYIIYEADKALQLTDSFGEKTLEDNGNIAGYNKGYSYGNHPFYFRICYHEAYWRMGVAINFSAQSLIYYRTRYKEITGSTIEPYEILRLLDHQLRAQKIRLSRIDIFADYINEGLNVNEIRNDLIDGNYFVYLSTGKKNNSKISYFTENNIVDTIYIGAKGKNIRSILRIYNKKLEQIQQHGIRYDEASKCDDWVRMENEIRGTYAHALTDELLKINSQSEMCSLIRKCLLNKYTIKQENGLPHHITEVLMNSADDTEFYFHDIRYKDMSLQQSYEYLIKNSGLMPFLYKLYQLDAIAYDWFIDDLIRRTHQYKPNNDTRKWMKEHSEYYKKNRIRLNRKI